MTSIKNAPKQENKPKTITRSQLIGEMVADSLVEEKNFSPFLTPGNYRLKVIETGLTEKIKGKAQFFFAEFEILESEGETALAAGGKAKWLRHMGNPDYAYPDIKKFVATALGLKNQQEIDNFSVAADGEEATLGNVIDASCFSEKVNMLDPNPLADCQLEARVVPNKKDEKYVYVNFSVAGEAG